MTMRNLTEPERICLTQLLQRYLLARAEAEKMIAAVGGAYLTGLGLPPNLHIDLDTGAMTLRVVAVPAPAPTAATNGAAKDMPALTPTPGS